MGVKITGRYIGNKKCEAIHEPSGSILVTDAPKDNAGEGSTFSPTDLFATSLGTCIMTTMAIFAERNGIEFRGATFDMEKIMHDQPRQVGRLPITVHLPSDLSKEQRARLERVAETCPVNRSLNPDIIIELKFIYDI